MRNHEKNQGGQDEKTTAVVGRNGAGRWVWQGKRVVQRRWPDIYPLDIGSTQPHALHDLGLMKNGDLLMTYPGRVNVYHAPHWYLHNAVNVSAAFAYLVSETMLPYVEAAFPGNPLPRTSITCMCDFLRKQTYQGAREVYSHSLALRNLHQIAITRSHTALVEERMLDHDTQQIAAHAADSMVYGLETVAHMFAGSRDTILSYAADTGMYAIRTGEYTMRPMAEEINTIADLAVVIGGYMRDEEGTDMEKVEIRRALMNRVIPMKKMEEK